MREPSNGKTLPARDTEAFTSLFALYSPGLCGYLRGMVRSGEDGDDLAQEVFVKAWLALPQLRDQAKFKAWLYQIANHALADYRRSPRQRRRLAQASLEQRLAEGEDVADQRRAFEERVAEKELARLALQALPEKERMCLLLEIEGRFSRQEIAELVGMQVSSVGTCISSARRHCREYRRLNDGGQSDG